MNIQASNIGFNLPITNKGTNAGQKLLKEPAHSPVQTDNKQTDLNARKNSVETLKKAFNTSLISKETNNPQKPIQAYLENASLASQAARDELQQLLGIDFFA